MDIYINNVRVDNVNVALYDRETWAKVLGWQYNGSYWFKNNVKFINMRDTIIEIFEEDTYGFINPRGRVVVDVGAFIGDSAIYFALRGAERVIAIEPHPGAYREMLENIKLNNMEDKIIPINAGLASRKGRIRISDDVSIDNTATVQYLPSDSGEIAAMTLGEIIKQYNIDSYAVLKMDCQGCEFDVILNDYDHVSHFKELIFEHHAYNTSISVRELLRELRKNYRCCIRRGGKYTGIVHCTRI